MKQIFKIFTMLTLAALPLMGWADVGGTFQDTSSGLYFEILTEGTPGTVKVVADPSSTNKYTGEIIIPVQATNSSDAGDTEYDVVEVGERAFNGCSNLTSITFADESKVTIIGKQAFNNCTRLATTKISKGVTTIGESAFNNCKALESLELPEGVTTIGASAFNNCTRLATTKISKGVTTIGDYAFNGCEKLASIELPEGVTTIGVSTFYNCKALASVKIPSTVETIGASAFNGCEKLESIELPERVTKIGVSAFQNCKALTSIVIPEGVTAIGNFTFEGCTGLASIEIKGKVTTIGNYAFNNCKALESLELPEEVTTIGNYAFNNCTKLTDLTFKGKTPPTTIGNDLFYNISGSPITIHVPEGARAAYKEKLGNNMDAIKTIEEPAFQEDGLYYEMIGLENEVKVVKYPDQSKYSGNITIPATVTHGDAGTEYKVVEIGSYAFGSCDGLTSIVIPEGITTIGEYAFNGCKKLATLELPEGVTTIGESAFNTCEKLASIVISSTVQEIGKSAFANCKELTDLTFKGGDTPEIETTLFSNITTKSITIHVPYGKKGAYETALSANNNMDAVKAIEEAANPNPPVPPVPPIYIWYKVSVPAVAGITFVRNDKEYESINTDVLEGNNFSFSIKPTAEIDVNKIEVTTNRGEVILPRESDGKYVIRNILEDVTVNVRTNPTGNESPVLPDGTKLYTAGGTLYIDMQQAGTVRIYTASGAVVYNAMLTAGSHAIPLNRGVHLVVFGNGAVAKVVL